MRFSKAMGGFPEYCVHYEPPSLPYKLPSMLYELPFMPYKPPSFLYNSPLSLFDCNSFSMNHCCLFMNHHLLALVLPHVSCSFTCRFFTILSTRLIYFTPPTYLSRVHDKINVKDHDIIYYLKHVVC